MNAAPQLVVNQALSPSMEPPAELTWQECMAMLCYVQDDIENIDPGLAHMMKLSLKRLVFLMKQMEEACDGYGHFPS